MAKTESKNKSDAAQRYVNLLTNAGFKAVFGDRKNKEFRYDFMCTGEDGTVFIVETQCYNDYYWFRRCVSYASRMYNMQNHRGKGDA